MYFPKKKSSTIYYDWVPIAFIHPVSSAFLLLRSMRSINTSLNSGIHLHCISNTNDTILDDYFENSLDYTLFFNSASVLLNFFMNWASNVASVLLNANKHHHSETLFLFTIFVFISRPRYIYVVSMWSIFNFRLYFHYD